MVAEERENETWDRRPSRFNSREQEESKFQRAHRVNDESVAAEIDWWLAKGGEEEEEEDRGATK